MARSGSKSGRRDPSVIANDLLSLPYEFGPRLDPVDLSEIEDRRFYHPDPFPAFRSVRDWSSTVDVSKRRISRRSSHPSFRFSFSNPRSVLVCVRRQRRREVLHALRVAGRRGLRGGRRSFSSAISCRRK